MLSIRNLTKSYGKTVANNNISFDVGEGEAAVLLGPNGAGKSTLIKSVAGLLRYSGNIEICGYDNRSPEARALIGYVPEIPAVYSLLTVTEHIEFILRAYKVQDRSFADELMERFELTDKRDKLGKELSKGMQQKLSICCALAYSPRIVIFDEPMVGLDPHAIKELKNLISELKSRGASILISTHMIDSIEGFWDTAHILMNGSLAATMHSGGVPESAQKLEDLFFEITEQHGS